MTLSPILGESRIQALSFFDPKEIAVVEALLTEKNGKPAIRCQVRNKELAVKPEEIVRQLWLYRLLTLYSYPVSRIAVEYPVTFGRDSSKRADIVIMDADRPTVPYIIIEVKRDKMKDGKEQLKSYTHATGAPLALWSNGAQPIIWHRKNPNYFVPIPDLPTARQTIENIINEPWTLQDLIEKERQREAEGVKSEAYPIVKTKKSEN